MTGSEAWSIVAPLIAHHMDMQGTMLNEAYVLVFAALKEWDRKGEKDGDHHEG